MGPQLLSTGGAAPGTPWSPTKGGRAPAPDTKALQALSGDQPNAPFYRGKKAQGTLSVKAESTAARAQQTRPGRAPRGQSARASLAPTSPGTQLGTPAPPPASPTSGPPRPAPSHPTAAPGSPPAPGLPRSPPLTLAPPGLRPFGNRGRASTPLARPVRRHLGVKLAPPASAARPSAARPSAARRPPPAARRPPPAARRPPRTQAAVRRQPGLPPDLLFTQNQPPRRRHSFKRRTPVRACALWLPTAEARGQDPGWDRGAGSGGGTRPGQGPLRGAGCGV